MTTTHDPYGDRYIVGGFKDGQIITETVFALDDAVKLAGSLAARGYDVDITHATRSSGRQMRHAEWRPLWRKIADEYEAHTRHFTPKALIAGAALALALMTSPASAKLTTAEAQPIIDALTPLVPIGCVLQHVAEDYTGQAVCAGGYIVWLNAQGTGDKAVDIPYVIGERVVGPDANGTYWTWPIMD